MIDPSKNLATLQRSLDYHSARHDVIAANLANAHTPGYRPVDVLFSEALEQARALERTHASHLGSGGTSGNSYQVFDASSKAPGLDGNAVSMEQELAKLAANSLRYASVTEMLSRRLAMMRYVANDGRR